MESMFFMFDNIKSSDMDIYIMRIGGENFVQTPLWGSVNVHESVSKNRLVPYFYGVTRDVLEFPPLQLFLCDENMIPKIWTSDDRNRIAKWLCHDTYKEFISSDDLGKRYMVLAEAQVDLNLINTQGYIEVQFRCNSPYAFSPIYIDSHDMSDITSTKIIQLENKSNVLKYYNPLLEIEFIDTNVQLKNLSNAGKIMKFENMTVGEIVGIDCQNRIMKSNLFGENPFSKFNVGIKRYYLDLVYGFNNIEITGRCRLKIRSQFPIAQ